MNPDFWLGVLAAFAGFVLKTTLGFVLCLVLTRLVEAANRRFILWLGFLVATSAYWLLLASSFSPAAQPAAATSLAFVQPVSHAAGALQIPDSWAVPLGLGLRGLAILYLLILSFMLLSHLRRRRHLRWVLEFTTEPPVEIAESFKSLAQELHVGRSRLLVLSGAASPATVGWIRPKVLLPDFCLEENRAELEDVLRHELHHVRRWDSVWNGFAITCRALLFFHPAAWYAVKKMQFDRELACDLAVISRSPGRREKYAECLIRFARLTLRQEAGAWGIDFAAPAKHLTIRVHSILAASKNAPRWLLCTRSALGLALSAGFLGVAPSLAVLLSYEPKPVLQTLTPEIHASPSLDGTAAKTARKHPHTLALLRTPDAAFAGTNPAGDSQPAMDLSGPTMERSSSQQASAGPQLVHRGLAAEKSPASTKSQTVTLVDPDGDSGKAEKQGHKQAIQQSATAALGIYKRLSELDRR